MSAPTAIIADDEANLRQYLRNRLTRLWPELITRAEAKNREEALQALRRWRPDFAFLDIRMPGVSGIEVARQDGGQTPIVFVTACDEYAIESFHKTFSGRHLVTLTGRDKPLPVSRGHIDRFKAD